MLVEASTAIRRCFIPLVLCHSLYVIAYGVLLVGQIVVSLGLAEREAGLMTVVWLREFSTWITAMIVAGVAGSAITADLGARKVRDELDALAVLSVDARRSLVVPRVVAITLVAPLLSVMSVFIVTGANYLVGPGHLGYSTGVFRANVVHNLVPLDFIALMIKSTVIGFFVGVVCCQKGLGSSGGAVGVGRAVNQAVVVTFLGIWVFNSLFNVAYLSLFPDVAVIRG
ncbi:MAG: ABC transporter permease [Solirubrobacteraceae bacterium]